MELHDLAWRILTSGKLQEKLPETAVPLTDLNPAGRASKGIPMVPDREGALKFGRERRPFPAPAALTEPRRRGEVLHFFANHELLAMELMALALLRFPQAPGPFRAGIGRTILEEAGHLRLYVNRMEELGVAFGDLPLNDFFWRLLVDMPSPIDYCVRMSLTLEQANLDFSKHYSQLFRKLGDSITASIMDRVYEEEIGHVRHGLVWFDRWRNRKENRFDDFAARLPMPLSPARAKGSAVFDREGRHRAGLDLEFIDRLYRYQRSKGRRGTLHHFNPAAETENLTGVAVEGPAAVTDFQKDFAAVMLFLAVDGDGLLLDEPAPQEAWLEPWRQLGCFIPEFIGRSSWNQQSCRRFASLTPWGPSPAAQALARTLNLAPTSALPAFGKELLLRWKATIADPALAALIDGPVRRYPVSTPEQLDQASKTLAAITSDAVAKGRWGCNGRTSRRFDPRDRTRQDQRWLAATLARHGMMILEPWLNRRADFSIQIDTTRPDPWLGLSEFRCDAKGRYRQAYLGRARPLGGPWHSPLAHAGIWGRCRDLGNHLGAFLRANGFRGAAGLDLYAFENSAGQLAVRASEINARHTMGHVALRLARYVGPGPAVWRHLSAYEATRGPYTDLRHWAQALQASYPPRIHAGQLHDGVLFTNDPQAARTRLGIVAAGRAACAQVEWDS